MQHRLHSSRSTPRPRLFDGARGRDRAVRIDALGRTLDDVVEAFLAVAETGEKAEPRDLRRLAAATRRLWTLALGLCRLGGVSS